MINTSRTVIPVPIHAERTIANIRRKVHKAEHVMGTRKTKRGEVHAVSLGIGTSMEDNAADFTILHQAMISTTRFVEFEAEISDVNLLWGPGRAATQRRAPMVGRFERTVCSAAQSASCKRGVLRGPRPRKKRMQEMMASRPPEAPPRLHTYARYHLDKGAPTESPPAHTPRTRCPA